MRKIKYITSLLFIAVIFVFIGDMYVWNLDSFETKYISTTMYLPSDVSQKEMLSDIEKTAIKYDCLIFTVSRNFETVYTEEAYAFCMDGVEDILFSNSSVESGVYHSIFLGNIEFNIRDFKDIPDLKQIETYYIIGDIEDARIFKSELIDKYGGNSPKEGYTYFNSTGAIACVWIIGILLFLLLTLFETVLLKKELVVRFIYGESLANIIAKRIICDLIVYVSYCTLIAVILSSAFNIQVDYRISITVICFIIFILLNALLYLRLIFIDYKSSLSKGKGNKSVLTISYLYKAITIVVITLVMSICIEMIARGMAYWQQKNFFEEFNNYSYVSISSEDNDIDTTDAMMLDFFNEKNKQGKAMLNMYLDSGVYTETPCLLFNKGFKSYLKDEISAINNYSFENKIYFIVPKKYGDMAVQDLEFFTDIYVGENLEYSVITYDSDISLVGIINKGKITSDIYNNPLIILNLRENTDYYNGIYISQSCMYDIQDSEWNDYIKSNPIERNTTYKTNVYDNYNYYLKSYQRTFLFGLVALIILMLMEFIIIRTTVHYECAINAMELTIKTVLGESAFCKYKKMFIITIVTLVLSAILSLILINILGLSSVLYLIIGYLLILFIDIAITLHYIKILEKANIRRILNGSVL